MRSLFSVPYFGGWFNAICAVVSAVFRRVAAWHGDRAYAIGRICGGRATLHRHKVRALRSGDHQRFMPEGSGHHRRLLLQLHEKGLQGLAVVALCLLAPAARGQELSAEWFKENYLPAAEKLNKAYSECSAKVSEVNTSDKSANFNEVIHKFAFDGTQRKFERTIEDHIDGEINRWTRVIVASPNVSFMVLTRKEQRQILEYVNRSSMGFSKATTRIDEEASDSIYSGFAFIGERVSSWIKHKGFQFKNVKRSGDTLRLDFACKDEDGRSYEGFINFLPDRQWVIADWDIKLTTTNPPYSWRNVTTVSYSGDDPVPALAGIVDIGYHPDRTNTKKMTVDELKFAAVPANEFKLSSYGYDNRIGSPASVSKSLWFWIAVGGVACLLAAFAIRQIMAKRAAA